MTLNVFMFYLLSATILVFSVLTVTSRRILRAAVFLLDHREEHSFDDLLKHVPINVLVAKDLTDRFNDGSIHRSSYSMRGGLNSGRTRALSNSA